MVTRKITIDNNINIACKLDFVINFIIKYDNIIFCNM